MRKLAMDELGRKSIEEFRQAKKTPVVAVLENIRSMHNVGSVFRTADAFLIQGIYLCGYTAQPPRKEIDKVALGATETVQWKHFKSASEAINELKTMGYKILAVEQTEASKPLHKLTIEQNQKIAVVFGNEVEGVTNEALSLADASIEIPQLGMKHSLNISVAAGIVLWKLTELTVYR